MDTVQLGSLEKGITRPKLKVWLCLEDIRENISKASESKDEDNLVLSIFSYVSVGTGIAVDELEILPWYEILHSYNFIVDICTPTMDFAILKANAKEAKKDVWEYEGRTWYMWSNSLAGKYGWTLEYISELDIDDAIGLIQEIFVDEQLHREWEWSLTEIAYPYNKVTKKSEYKPLHRPSWMQGVRSDIIEKVKTIKIDPIYLPIGNVQRWEQ